jgi:hypothetical protein
MAATPQIALRDGSGFASTIVFTTNQELVTIVGTIATNIIALQVSVNGSPYSSDPSLVFLDFTNFTVPTLSAMPDGLPLDVGVNTILIRAVDILGGVSPPATVSVTRILSADNTQLTPTGIKVERNRNSVNILVYNPTFPNVPNNGDLSTTSGDFQFRGFNVYASTTPAGVSGYFKVNPTPLTGPVSYDEADFTLDELSASLPASARYLRVQVTQEDVFGNEIARNIDTKYDILDLSSNIRYNYEVLPYTLSPFITFTHTRSTTNPDQINSDRFNGVQPTAPLYYVATGIYYDTVLSQEIESPYSQEVLGSPLIIDTNVRDLPGRNQTQIVIDFVTAIERVNQEISIIPGSTTRDVNIDPFSSEAERLWFLVDFIHRSQSFVTLLQIDDTNGDGISDPVAASAYKQALRSALGYTTDTAVQQLIDTQFEKLAKNFNKTRLPGRPSVGQVVFYTPTRPTIDILIPTGTIVSSDADTISANISAQRYRVGGTFVLPAADADAFYNFNTKRYEITADVVAQSVGENGNRPAGTIVNVQGLTGVSVTNTESTVFGTSRESNADLAARATLGFVSVDTGTEGGYASTAAEQIGVVKAKIIKSGDPLMMRDYDPVRHKHIGGKVDIFIQGLRERTLSETFAFTFDVARDIRIEILDLPNLIFRVLDSRVTVNTPVIEILDNLPLGFGVRNDTSGLNYDLLGVAILTYNTFKINTSIPQPLTAIDDIITADYRFRSVNQFTFTLQPVRRVISVVGEISGALTTAGYALYKTEDPLENGESTIAKDHMVITQIGNVPSGATITVTDEQHVLIGFFEEPLNSIGINTATLRVFSQDRSVEYDGPGSVSPDFDIIPGTPTTPAKIVRVNPSDILSGQTVSVDYNHDENFTVTYVINDLLQQLQRTINVRRHVTADVLAKQSVENPIAIETTIQLKQGASKDKADPAVRTNVSLELNQKLIGQGSAQSDIINAVDSTDGVDFQVIPLAKMGYQDGSRKIRESISSTFVEPRPTSLDIGGNLVYILTDALLNPTTDGGGLVTEHKGVFQDDEAMVLSSSLASVATSTNGAYIIGNGGAVIAGYSDDTTLIADGFTTAAAIEAERLRRTANHVIVALSGAGLPPDSPLNHVYTASYVIRGDVGPHDIVATAVEFIELGDLTLTFRNATP